jgi:post-segregation antitoxin (ccd killing protein)
MRPKRATPRDSATHLVRRAPTVRACPHSSDRRCPASWHQRSLTPLHQYTKLARMRLSVNLDDELYAVARSLARSQDITISAAVNRLIRRGLELKEAKRTRAKSGFPVVRCERTFTSEDVYALDTELS